MQDDTNKAPLPDSDTPTTLRQNPKALAALAGLVALLLVVFIVLPRWVQNAGPLVSATSQQPDATRTENTASGTPAAKPLESPWNDAQVARERRKTQDILAKLLSQQEQLEKQEVSQWANSAYKAALATAQRGDEFYRSREFEQAKQAYNDTLVQFKAINEQAPAAFEAALSRGDTALDAGDADVAIAAYTLALKIDSNREAAQVGLQRAMVLTDVQSLLKQGQLAEANNDYDTAKEHYLAALAKDPSSEQAQTRLTEIKQLIIERDFTEAMSKGFSALADNQFARAQKAFKQALALKPDAADAQHALAQAQNQQQQFRISQQLEQAQAFERKEQWQEAVTHYDAALALDRNVVSAKIGQIRSETRLTLHNNIQDILDNPTKLQSDKVYRYAQTLLSDLRGLPSPGPVAQAQAQQLAQAIELARVPVAVQLKSDTQTKVILYRVGELGTFTEHAMNLTPGKYTLVGTREGYRDVRKEFVLEAGIKTAPVIVIQCEEKIANG